MTTSSSSEEKTPEIKCGNDIVPISKLTANYPLIPRAELKVHEQLGAGTYGSVFKGIWNIKSAKEPMVVALKKVFMLEREVDILSQVRHRNIIQFFGVSHANPDFYIVTEYAENGSLFEYLHNAKVDLSFERILKLAKQVAHGVAYLHHEAPTTIIHRDLKSRNVVLGRKMVCKICDFGTSKDLTHSHTAPTWGGTAAWMSPEIINQREGITTATDVWSYGVLLWEILSREIPYKGLTDFKIYSITSQEGCQLLLPDTCPTHLSDLLKKCWYKTPKERIVMREILTSLETINIDKRVHSECVHFVKQKVEWHRKIEEQLAKINELELDYKRRKEELKRWEQILRRRESSHRNFLHVIDLMNTTNVAEWDADCVCEWVQYMAAGKDISEQVIDKIISRVLQHEICGSRLLQVTERDLENLGIEPASIRHYIVEKIAELNRPTKSSITSSPKNLQHSTLPKDDYLNFPPLNISAELEARNKQNKSAFSHPINLIVGMYSRTILSENVKKCRFKIFLDSDWETSSATNEIHSEIHDSATVIKDVFMSITSLTDNSVLLESVRCVCPPFGYLEWTEVNLNESPRIRVTLAVTYTDQIIQPRNTRINVEVVDFSQMSRIISTKMVSLKIRPMPTNTSLSRISSSMFNNQSATDKSNSLQGVWRNRRGSVDNSLAKEQTSSSVVNEIIPISLMSPGIMEIHRRYQQRFARRSLPTSDGLGSQKAASPKSPLANNANSRGPFSKPRLVQNYRSTSASLTSKSSVIRRGPPLTVMVPNNTSSTSRLAGRKIVGCKVDGHNIQHQQQSSQRNKFMRWRTKSETETIEKDIFTAEDNLYENQPTFYVCDEDSPSTSMADNAVDTVTRLVKRSPGPTRHSDIKVLSATERKLSNLENESPNSSVVDDGLETNDARNDGLKCRGDCLCRSRRAVLPEAIDNDDLTESNAACEANSEEFAERKYRPRPNSSRKYKKLANKAKSGGNRQADNGGDMLHEQEFCAEPEPKTCSSVNINKQNIVSRQIYGGYNKWRWK